MVSGPGLLFFLSRRGIGERAAAAPVLELVWSRFAACVGCSADRLGWLALPLSSRGDGAGLRHAHVRERAVLALVSLRVRREE